MNRSARFFLASVVLGVGCHALAEGDGGGGESALVELSYKCATGTKRFKTRVTRGSETQQPELQAEIEMAEEKLTPQMKLIVEGRVVSENEGSVSWHPQVDDEKNLEIFAKQFETKMKASAADPLDLNASVEIRSGSCVATIPFRATAPRVLAQEFIDKAGASRRSDALKAKCVAEVNRPEVRAAYLNGYICTLDQCDAKSAALQKQENQKAQRSGYVNKVLMYAIGSYQVMSKRERAAITRQLTRLGGATNCRTARVETNFFVNMQGHASCIAGAPAASVSKSSCFAQMMTRDGEARVGYWGGASAHLEQIAKKGWDPSDESMSFASREDASEEDESKLDPDVLANRRALAKQREEARYGLTEVVTEGGVSLWSPPPSERAPSAEEER